MSKIPGGPSPAKAAMMQAGARAGAVGTSQRYHWQQPVDSRQASTDFPIVPVGPDPYDDIANIKDQYAFLGANAGGGNRSNWVVPFEQADAAYLMRKRAEEEGAQFDMWVTQKYDLTDPSQNLMLQSIAPELYQRREEVIDTQQNMASHYAKLRLRGAKSIDDLYFEWLIETGRMQLPKGPIWDPKKWREAQVGSANESEDRKWNRDRYYAGFFSPLKWMGGSGPDAQYGEQANANRFDISGNNVAYINNTAGGPYTSAGSNTLYAQRYANVFKPHPAPAVAEQRDQDGNIVVPAVGARGPRNH